jgi:hypothetical protein
MTRRLLVPAAILGATCILALARGRAVGGQRHDERAPDGSRLLTTPRSVDVPKRVPGSQGALTLWFRPERTLRGGETRLSLIEGPLSASIQVTPPAVAIESRLAASWASARVQALLTHLEGGHLYHAAWTWDQRRLRFYLDGVGQAEAWLEPLDPAGQRPRTPAPRVGDTGLAVGGLRWHDRPLGEKELRDTLRRIGHEGYTDEGVRSTEERFVPDDVGTLLFETRFADATALADFVLEGGRRMSVDAGRLVLESVPSASEDPRGNHLVCWLKKEIPADFLLELGVCPESRSRGLNIVFFSARGLRGESIFDPGLAPRNGFFAQYHSGDLASYHASYWAGGRGTANIRKNPGFALVAVGRDLVSPAPEGVFQTVRVYKRGGRIRVTVDDVVAVAFDDDGAAYGPVHDHSGWIGLRQMSHTGRCAYDHLKVSALRDPTTETPGQGASSGPR